MMTVEEIVAKADKSEISSVRSVLTKIVEAINNPNTGALDLKNLIEKDPPLASRVLRIANSALYGVKRPLMRILDAIVIVGFEAVREIALSQKVCEIFARGEKHYGYTRTAVWMHSVSVALCGKTIYRKEFCKPGEDIYTAGLLHDIGIIVEDQFCHKEFLKILEQMNRNQTHLFDEERKLLGFTHQDVGKQLATVWKLPPELAETIGLEGCPEESMEEKARMVQTLYVANYACNARKLGFNETPKIKADVYNACLQRLGIGDKGLRIIMDEVAADIDTMKAEGWF